MSRKPSSGPIMTSSTTPYYNDNLLTASGPPHLQPPAAAAGQQQRARSGSDILPRSSASSASTTTTPSFVATLASTNHTRSGSGRTAGTNTNASTTSRRSTVTSSSPSSSSSSSSLAAVTSSDMAVGSITPMPCTSYTSSSRSVSSAAGGNAAASEVGHTAGGARSATSTPNALTNQRSELRRNKRKEVTNYHIQLERVLGLTTTRPSALSMNKRTGLVAYAAGCVVVLFDYHRGTQVGSLACSSLTASWTYPPSSDERAMSLGSSVSTSSSPSAGSAASQYWQPWMNHPMASPYINPLAGLMPMSVGGGGGGVGGHLQHASSDLLPPPGGGGLLSSTSPSSNRKTDSESSSKVPASLKPKPISCLAFSPDGQYLAVGETGHQPRILVWDVIQRVPIVELIGHQFGVQALQFSANGKILVSLGFQHDGFVNVWNWRSRLKLATNKVTSKVNALIPHNADGSVSHAGTTTLSFITVGLRHVKFWYLGQSKAHARAGIADIRLLDGRSAMLGEMRDANFVDAVSSPDGEQTYLITASGVLCMLNKDRTMDKFVDLQVRAGYSISMDGYCIVCACSDGIIRLFEPVTLKYHTTLPLPSPLGYSPWMSVDSPEDDGTNMYSDAAATLLDADARRLFSVYGDRSIRIWDISPHFDVNLVRTHLHHSDCVWGVETVPPKDEPTEGNQLLKSDFMTFSADGTVRFWGTCPSSAETGESDSQDELALLHVLYPDSSYLQWLAPPDVQAIDPAGLSAPLENGIRVAKISPSGDLLATGDRGGNLRVHNLHTMAEITYQEAHENDILAIDFTDPTHPLKTASSASENSTNSTDDVIHEGSDAESTTAPFFVATAGRDRLLHVFDIRDRFRLVQTLDDHSSSITCLRLSPDGSTLVSGGADKSIVFRSLQETEAGPKYSPYHHSPGRATVHDMAVVPCNGSLTAVSGDRRIYVYNLKSGKATKSMKADAPCIDASMSVSSSAGPIGSLNQGGASGISTGASGGMAGLAALPPSSSLGIVENCSMTHIDLDPSGTIAVASGSDKSIRVYDLMQKLCLARMVCHSELITGVKLSSDFKHIYSTSGDGCILVWRLSSALIKKIDSRQQMMQDKLTLAKSQEQARRMAQQEDDDGDGPMDEREAHHEQRRKNNRWRSLSQSAAVAQSASRRPSTSHNVLPPPLPPPRTLSPSPSAGKTLRHSPSMDRQLHPYIYKDSLSASDLSNASRRNSEASILSDDANDSVSAEEVSSSDGLSYPDRPRQQGQLAARPSTPNRHRMKSGHRPGAPMSSKSDATEANESAFQVSIASPESLLIHKRLSRTLGSNSESTTPTGDRSRTNSISNSLPSSLTSMSMNFQAHSATTAGAASTSTSFTPKTVQRSTTPTPVSQASSGLPSSTSTSSLANRPAWGRAPLPAPKGVTPTKSSVVTTTAPASSARRRQRTTSVISGRISFLAANNNNNTLSNAFNNHSQDLADQDNNTTSTLPTGAKTLPGQGGESDEMEDPLSDSATGSDMEDPELVRATQIAQFSVSTEAAEFDHHGSEQDHGPSFAEGEDMAVHRSGTASPRLYRSSLQQQQQRQSQRVRASMGVSAAGHTGGDASATSVAIKPGRQSLTLRFLSASRSKLLDALQPTGSGSNAVEGEGEGVRAHGDKSHVEPPPMLGMSQPSTLEIEAMEGRLNPTSPSSSSQDGMSAKRAKLQQPPPIARGDAGQRSSSSALSASESFLSLGVEEVEHPRTEGDLHHRQHHAGHVLASPAFVQSPVAGLNMMKDHGDGGGGIVHRLQQTLEDAVGSLPVRDHHAMEVDEEEDNVKKDEKTVLHDDDRSPLNRAKAIANVMDQLQMLLGDSCPLGSPPLLLQPSSDLPERRPSLPQLDRATLEGTKDRLLQMVGSIQGQLWLMQAEESQPVLHPKPQAGR